jgi:iron(III) transport system substrate-binding protein
MRSTLSHRLVPAGHRRAGAGLLLTVVAITFAAAACSSAPAAPSATSSAALSTNWNTVIAQAKKEGTVTFYGAITTNLLENATKAFTKEYGIKVNLVPLSTTPLEQRITNNLKANQQDADVVNIGDQLTTDTWVQQGIIDTKPDIPAASEWPSQYWQDGVGQITLAVETIAYNTKLVPASEVPTSWTSVLNPEWKGKIGILDPASDDVAQPWQWLYDTYGQSYLTQIKALDPKVYDSGADMLNAVTSGEIDIAVVAHQNLVDSLSAQGAPIASPKLTTEPGWYNQVFMMSSAPHPAAARLLLNFILSKQGQLAINGGGQGVSGLNLPGTVPLPTHFIVPSPTGTLSNLNHLRSLLGLAPVNAS